MLHSTHAVSFSNVCLPCNNSLYHRGSWKPPTRHCVLQTSACVCLPPGVESGCSIKAWIRAEKLSTFCGLSGKENSWWSSVLSKGQTRKQGAQCFYQKTVLIFFCSLFCVRQTKTWLQKIAFPPCLVVSMKGREPCKNLQFLINHYLQIRFRFWPKGRHLKHWSRTVIYFGKWRQILFPDVFYCVCSNSQIIGSEPKLPLQGKLLAPSWHFPKTNQPRSMFGPRN